MTKGGTRGLVMLAAAAFAAAILAACGGSSEPPATNSSTQTESAESNERSEVGGDPDAVSTPLKVSGGGSDQFRAKGGDNSIQEYGEEGDASELQQAAEAVHGFYVTRAEEDWASACSYLGESMVRQLEQLAKQSPQLKSKGCPAILHVFTRPLPPSARREETVVDAGSLRREDDRGFLIYYGADKTPYAMALKEEDGAWKLTLLAPTPLG